MRAGSVVVFAFLCAVRTCAADAINWNAMLMPGSVTYSGDVSLLHAACNIIDLAISDSSFMKATGVRVPGLAAHTSY